MTKHSILPLWVTLVLFGAAGCSSQVIAGGGEDMGSGGSSAGSGGSGGDAGSGSGAGSGGNGGGEACEIPPAKWLYGSLVLFDGTEIEVNASPPQCPSIVDQVIEGVVIDASPGALTIDSCQPGANCSPMLSTLMLSVNSSPDIMAPLVHGIPSGTFVRLRAYSLHVGNQSPPRCVFYISVANLPAWGGVPNPVEDSSRLWFIAQDRSAQLVTGGEPEPEPFTVKAIKICMAEFSPVYRLDFGVAGDPAPGISLRGGEQGTLTLAAAEHAGSYDLQNLRSYDIDWEPTDYSTEAYTILRSDPAP